MPIVVLQTSIAYSETIGLFLQFSHQLYVVDLHKLQTSVNFNEKKSNGVRRCW